MRTLHRTLWATAISTCIAGGALAQTTGTTGTTGGGGNTGGGLTTGAGTGSGAASQALQAPEIAAPSQTATSNAALQASNAFNKYYANPYFQGRAGVTTGGGGSGGTTANTPGGFGAPLYGTTGTGTTGATGARGGAGGGTTGTAGRATTGSTAGFGGSTTGTGGGGAGGSTAGFGGASTGTTAGAGGRGGQGASANSSSQQNSNLSSGRQIAYTATLKFAPPALPPSQMQTDLRGMIDASSGIANAKGISIAAGEGGVVVLKGAAKDEDEARLIEGMIRLTPGVRSVQNELKFPVQ